MVSKLYDPTAPPAPRTLLLDASGHQLRRFERSERVRFQRLGADGQPDGVAYEAQSCLVTYGPDTDHRDDVPCVDLTGPTREVSIELTLQPWAYWFFTDPGLPARVARRR